MEPFLLHADEVEHDVEEQLVRSWRAEQLRRLGLGSVIADAFADRVDWHALADLIERGCSPELALEIVR